MKVLAMACKQFSGTKIGLKAPKTMVTRKNKFSEINFVSHTTRLHG